MKTKYAPHFIAPALILVLMAIHCSSVLSLPIDILYDVYFIYCFIATIIAYIPHIISRKDRHLPALINSAYSFMLNLSIMVAFIRLLSHFWGGIINRGIGPESDAVRVLLIFMPLFLCWVVNHFRIIFRQIASNGESVDYRKTKYAPYFIAPALILIPMVIHYLSVLQLPLNIFYDFYFIYCFIATILSCISHIVPHKDRHLPSLINSAYSFMLNLNIMVTYMRLLSHFQRHDINPGFGLDSDTIQIMLILIPLFLCWVANYFRIILCHIASNKESAG